MKTEKTLITVSLASLALLIFVNSALAFGGGDGMRMGMERNDANFQAMQDALTNKDYAAWKDLMTQDDREPLWVQFISQDEFASFAELSVAQMNEMQEHRDAVEQALTDRDYETWKSLMSDHPGQDKFLDKITADNFDKFAEAMELAQAGDFEGAKAIREELGIGFGKGMRHGQLEQ